MELFFGSAAVVVIILALLYFRRLIDSSAAQKKSEKHGVKGFVNCPLCESPLLPGQNIISKVFGKAGKADDQLCFVYGCPNCYPFAKPGIVRRCPVCHKKVLQDGYLVSRLFNKTKSGKPHVIVNGCGNCNRHGM